MFLLSSLPSSWKGLKPKRYLIVTCNFLLVENAIVLLFSFSRCDTNWEFCYVAGKSVTCNSFLVTKGSCSALLPCFNVLILQLIVCLKPQGFGEAAR